MLEVFLDSLIDTLKVFPFLVAIYIIIELIEHKTEIVGSKNRLNGKLGPLIGSATGLIPQCGFSVMASRLYESGFIGLGTLIAIFISTSDEAFIIMLSKGDGFTLMYTIVVKVILGVAFGYLINAFIKKEDNLKVTTVADYKERVLEKKFAYTSCGRDHNESNLFQTYVLNPLLHSLKIALYILIVNFAFGTLLYFVGEEAISAFLERSIWAQPFITSFVGLIPNCASSVVITETYLVGGIRFGSLIAGLSTNAGLGLVVLIKNTKKWKRNLFIILILYFIGSLSGSLINLIEFLV